VTLTLRGLHFLARLRPVDFLFMAVKVTHIDYIHRTDPELPLERFVRAYGVHETCSMLLQVLTQEYFFVNVDFEKDLQLQVNAVIQKHERMPMMEKFFDTIETTPNWVVGRIYTLKAANLRAKALKLY
jgi:hypothetical protein